MSLYSFYHHHSRYFGIYALYIHCHSSLIAYDNFSRVWSNLPSGEENWSSKMEVISTDADAFDAKFSNAINLAVHFDLISSQTSAVNCH